MSDEELDALVSFYEPAPWEVGNCKRCDCDISIPDSHDGLCAVCADYEEHGK